MLKPRLVQVGTLAVLAAAATAPRGGLLAQGAQSVQGGQATVQLAFGYECDDRFLVRNEGTQNVTIEYGVPGAPQRSSLELKGNESVELASTTNEPLELWVAGRLVASEQKGNLPCAAQNTGVVVRQIGTQDYAPYAEPAYYAAPVVYVAPGYGYGYAGGYGYGYRSTVSVVVPFGSRFGGTAGRGRVVNGAGYRGDQARGIVRGVNGAGTRGNQERGSVRGVRTSEPGRVAHVSTPGRAPRTGGSGRGEHSGGTSRTGAQAGAHGHRR
jgi:hypothetical protein